MIDADRVTFVQQSYRYVDAENAVVFDRNPEAKLVRLDTNLSYASAVIRAADELAASSGVRVFDVEVFALLYFDDFVDGPPSFAFTSERDKCYNRVMKVVSFSADTNSAKTILRLRG